MTFDENIEFCDFMGCIWLVKRPECKPENCPKMRDMIDIYLETEAGKSWVTSVPKVRH
jgi:hypothetical protein